jgi:SWIM zinc finger
VILTTEQVLALAPDSASAAAARKLAHPRDWRNLGRSDLALWGECQGSALYQVRVHLPDATVKCSCPSRKFPCKHALALMLIVAGQPKLVALADPPPWVSEWLAHRVRTIEREQKPKKTTSPDPEAQAKRAGQRLERVREGVEALDLWMHDLVRSGLASVAAAGSAPWEAQAARLVDAQAGGLASRLRGLSGIPRATPDWAGELLADLGRLALLTHAFGHLDDLDAPLRADVRQLVGWALKEEEVVAAGDLVDDDWLVLGQFVDEDERFRVQRTWLKGSRSGRVAMILQFAAGMAPFGDTFAPATHFEATLAFWPSAFPLRALVHARTTVAVAWHDRLPGADSFAVCLRDAAHALGRQPWLGRLLCVVRDVVPVVGQDERWSIVDRNRAAVPLGGTGTWSLLAISGGNPIDVAGEWDGRMLRPLLASTWPDSITWSRPAT